MASGDRYKLTLNQTLLSQQVNNVLVYEQTAGGGDAENLNAAFLLDVYQELRNVQVTAVTTQNIDIINLDNDFDFATFPCSVGCDGLVDDLPMPPFVAYAFRKNRASRASRHGQIRVAGVGEGRVTGGVVIPTFLDELAALATALGSQITDGDGNTYDLRIPRFSPSGALVAVFPISSVEYVSVSTQNTRKFGHGG